jgi:hypothetical protein
MESGVSMEWSGSGTTRNCVSCGRAIGFDANVCPYCGHDYRMPAYAMAALPPQKSAMPVAGGVLILIAGILAIVMGAYYFALSPGEIEGSGVTLPPDISDADLQNIMYLCGSLCAVFGVIAVIGGYFGLMRKHFALGIVGGVFGLLGLGFMIGSLLALIGLILIAVSRKEFP